MVGSVCSLVNRAYEQAEAGLWLPGIARATTAEVAAAIRGDELSVAREEGQLAGSVRSRRLDPGTGWFGALAVDPLYAGRGIGGGLVGYVETRAAAAGATAMQLELLEPLVSHPHTDFLAAWYARLGYRPVGRRELVDVEPAALPFLAVPCRVVVMRKPLAAAR